MAKEEARAEGLSASFVGRIATRPVPATPRIGRGRLGFFAAVKALRTNPLTAFPEEAYDAMVLEVGRARRVLLVNDPDTIEHILVSNAQNYRKSALQQRRIQPALGEGLLTAEGEAWRKARRIASPLFNPRAVAVLWDDMRAAALAMRERWLASLGRGGLLDMSAEFQRLTYEIVSRTVFSGALDGDRARIHASMAVYFDTVGRVDLATILNLPRWLPTPAKLRALPALSTFRSTVRRVVASRTAAPGRPAVDLLDRMIEAKDPDGGGSLSEASVADNVLTFLAAGHETTANALAWTLYLLALCPDVMAEVRAEIDSVVGEQGPDQSAIERLVATKAAVSESLRLYPPAPFIGREAVAAERLAGKDVEAGLQIMISPWIVHRHRRLWERPDRFWPERFRSMKGQPIARGAYLPFGLGPRVCIGQGFAMQEILIVLATILPAFDFRLAEPEAILPQARITLTSAKGVAILVTPRR
jgi:cytochrome P450